MLLPLPRDLLLSRMFFCGWHQGCNLLSFSLSAHPTAPRRRTAPPPPLYPGSVKGRGGGGEMGWRGGGEVGRWGGGEVDFHLYP